MGVYSDIAQEKAFEKFNKGLYEEALVACRHHFTWYVLCYKAHTVPFLASQTKEAAELLKIDIEALGSLIDLLHLCYFRTGRTDEFPSVLARVTNAIDDPRWRDKILYQETLWWLFEKEDRIMALSVVSKVDIGSCIDPEILAIYLHVCPDDLPFNEIAGILDRILLNTDNQSYKLQYSVLKGIAYSLINDMRYGCEIIRTAINNYVSLNERDKSPYGDYQLAHALELLGQVSNDVDSISKADLHYARILEEAKQLGYSTALLAEITKCIGDCKAFLGQYKEAIRFYKESLIYDAIDNTKVFLARAYANDGNTDLSRQILKSINAKPFDDAFFYDYAVSWAILATHSLRPEDIEVAKVQLKVAKPHWPLFVEHKDAMLIQLMEITPKTSTGKLRGLVDALNRYVSLNPNLFGIGININRIVEDIGRRGKK
jgi:tetratricopeptide (TPR) repeat protein